MNKAKIALSQKEIELVTNAEWILTKNAIMQKAWWLLEDLQVEVVARVKQLSATLPKEVLKTTAKISKGENYRGLPYLVLDFPRCFDKDDIFAVRCMFWWGNFFSITLHLAGKYQKQYSDRLIRSYHLLVQNGFFVSAGDEQWEHHFDEPNYIEIGNITEAQFIEKIQSPAFIKIANKISVKEWDNARQKLSGYFELILEILSA
jgi:hypothetical protein